MNISRHGHTAGPFFFPSRDFLAASHGTEDILEIQLYIA